LAFYPTCYHFSKILLKVFFVQSRKPQANLFRRRFFPLYFEDKRVYELVLDF